MSKYAVVFRKETDNLSSMCTILFKSAKEAKSYIETDAQLTVCLKAGAKDLGWIKPDSFDYYCVELKNGVKCFWQYFKLSAKQ